MPANIQNFLFVLILGTAFLVLFLGIGLLVVTNPSSRKYNSYSLISVKLIALFPVLLLSSFFPSISDASTNVNLPGISVAATGAVAVFIFLYVFGTRKMKEAVTLDEQYQEKKRLEEDIRQLRYQKQAEDKTDSEPLPPGRRYEYKLKRFKGKRIIIVTGSLEFVRGVDVWVNSENTHMQMASHYDRSVSGLIRYCGAKKDPAGNVIHDGIYKELRNALANNFSVAAAKVLVTGPGELSKTHDVKKIFHVASVQGVCGEGFKPVGKLPSCVYNALTEADSPKYARDELRSIIFPIFGTGQARGVPKETVASMMSAVFLYFENCPTSKINDVYFVALFKNHLKACQFVLCKYPDVVPPPDQLELEF